MNNYSSNIKTKVEIGNKPKVEYIKKKQQQKHLRFIAATVTSYVIWQLIEHSNVFSERLPDMF